MLVASRLLMGLGSFVLVGLAFLLISFRLGPDKAAPSMADFMVALTFAPIGAGSAIGGALVLLADSRKTGASPAPLDRVLAAGSVLLTLYWAGALLGGLPWPWELVGL